MPLVVCAIAAAIIITVYVLIAPLAGFLAGRAKEVQSVDMAALMDSGMSKGEAMQASFMEQGMQRAARENRSSDAAFLGGGAAGLLSGALVSGSSS
jgi:hypothetical protein